MKKALAILLIFCLLLPAAGAEVEVFTAVTFTDSGFEVSSESLFSVNLKVAIAAPEGAVIRYTTDGSVPTEESTVYTKPITLYTSFDLYKPAVLLLRAKAWYADGSVSETATKTVYTSVRMKDGFGCPVMSIAADRNDLYGIYGILNEGNVKKRGRDWERECHVELMMGDGTPVFGQNAGVRVYGGASRDAFIKSLKLYARKSYDPEHGSFKTDIFGTPDNKGGVISSYDKLVLRNGGNDCQFAFVRDELAQRLVRKAGYTDGEGVVCTVVYLNGEYYGLLWLHESYCDDLLKEKYGGKKDGSYVVLEGSDTEKTADDGDELENRAAGEFNDAYQKFISSDLTDDAVYAELNAFMDVENYLQNFAFNIYLGNNDWPQNNFKCYRFYADDESGYKAESPRDGRWRFIYHDIDYTFGLYGQTETQSVYNKLAHVMGHPDEMWYSPLFDKLMEREDARDYFISEILRLSKGPLTSASVKKELKDIAEERETEFKRFDVYLDQPRKKDRSIFFRLANYDAEEKRIRDFAKYRASYLQNHLKECLGYEP